MKIRKYIFGIGVVLTSFLSACDTDNVGEIYENQNLGATFTSEVQSVNFPAYDYEGFDVEIMRSGNIQQAADVTLKVSMLNGKNEVAVPSEFVIPQTGSFGAGEFKTMVHVKVGDITSGKVYQIAFDINSEDASVAATTRKVVSVYRDYTYSKMGIGKINSAMFGGTFDVEILKADDIHWYKAVSMYDDGKDIVFKVLPNNKVVVERQMAFFDPGLGNVQIQGMGIFEDGMLKVDAMFILEDGRAAGPLPEILILPDSSNQ